MWLILIQISVLLGCTQPVHLKETGRSQVRVARQTSTAEDEHVQMPDAAPAQTTADTGTVRRDDDVKEMLAALHGRQQDVQQTLSAITRRLDSIVKTVEMLLTRQQDGRQHPDAVLVRQGDARLHVLGERCRSDSDCSSLQPDTVCGDQGLCECGEGLQQVVGEQCRPYPRLAESCRLDSDCQGATKHSACVNRVCACSAGFVNDTDTMCRRPRLSETCVTSRECRVLTKYSACEDNVCTCAARYWNDNNASCQPYPRLSEACNTTSDCQGYTEHSVCADGVCSCLDGFWNLYSDECRPGVAYGQACSYDRDCSTTMEKLTCSDRRCACRSKHFRTDTESCFVRLQGDGTCTTGYVEVAEDGTGWLNLCGNDWNVTEATVLCRTLGYDHGVPQSADDVPFSPAPLDMFWQSPTCSGSEKSIDACQWSYAWNTCSSTAPVAVKCFAEQGEAEGRSH